MLDDVADAVAANAMLSRRVGEAEVPAGCGQSAASTACFSLRSVALWRTQYDTEAGGWLLTTAEVKVFVEEKACHAPARPRRGAVHAGAAPMRPPMPAATGSRLLSSHAASPFGRQPLVQMLEGSTTQAADQLTLALRDLRQQQSR